ncbi:P-loop containing nucleoside triphosphate hydrolase protein [Lophiotrema nucula]|uniref:DNA helicase n=1 Tax=Lophiotrema nucula TaxID=690887 RepID=A0A6A5ZJ50_9PLEO|nr:P-loop containing nucleoside triphosphate hydrolase protein [Lophiotrema nucula]
MYRRDPIVTSSPPRDDEYRDLFEDSDDDELAEVYITQPTMPLNHVTQPTIPINAPIPMNGARSAFFAMPSAHGPTQPTQPLGTPRSKVQVARSSPPSGHYTSPVRNSQSQRPLPSQRPYNLMQPAGTYTLLPQPAARPVPVDLTSDDPPVEADSEEEDTTRSNIKPSRFESSTSRPSRIEETPHKRTFNMSGYAYNPHMHPQKRPASDAPSTPPKKFKPMPRQSGPSRAMPPQVEMTIHDIEDPQEQALVRRLEFLTSAKKPVQELYRVLKMKKGNYNDALEFLTREEASDDELRLMSSPHVAKPSQRSVPEPKRTAQVNLNAPRRSIHDKFSALKSQAGPRAAPATLVDLTASPDHPKQKRRLIRGKDRRNATPSEDEDETLGPDASTSEAEDDEDIEERRSHDESLLGYFNSCTVEGLVDLSGQKESDVRIVLEKRPFKTLAQIRKVHIDPAQPADSKKKTRRPKVPFGERLVDSAEIMWDGYQAVDELVERCKKRGKPITGAMANWGIDIFGASKDGEVAITSLSDNVSNLSKDSGIGTPISILDSGSDLESPQKGPTAVKKLGLLEKPSIMSEDLELKDYQVVGLNWLALLWRHNISGILADDMGLGKTCQVIAFLSHLKEQNISGPHLIVVPGSTLENWLREFARFSPTLHVEPYYGSQASRGEQAAQILGTLEEDRTSIDVVVTTYDLAFKPADNHFLRQIRPQACIFDEGHMLRSSGTQKYQKLMKIKARCRLLLTGTPLQNSLKELISILAFLMPDLFQDMEEDLQAVFKHKAKVNEQDSHGTLLSTQRIQRARSMLTPFILRRKKAQVLKHLPTKTTRVEYCEPTESQKRLYAAQLQQQRQVLLDRAAGIINKDHANVMMKLRQAAIHPLLFRDRYNDKVIKKMANACIKDPALSDRDPDTIYEELKLYQDYQCHHLALKYPTGLKKFELKNEEWMDSGKVQKLAELLKKFKENGDRTLVFSQFTSVMDILQWVLDTLNIKYFRLDGSTPIAERQDMLDQFYEDESIPVFMLSTKSGGAGINLACANKVIIFDSSFNPQDDIQAENRAHRVGQTREVEVVRLVTKGTVEEQIHALGLSKLELDNMVAGDEGAAGEDKKGGKKKDDDKAENLSKAEEKGIEAVEEMLMAQLTNGGEEDNVKDQFLDGLKKAGLDMSAA